MCVGLSVRRQKMYRSPREIAQSAVVRVTAILVWSVQSDACYRTDWSKLPLKTVQNRCWMMLSSFGSVIKAQVNKVKGGDAVFIRCLSVCLSVSSGPVNQTSLKLLKLRTSNLTCMFPWTVRTWHLKFFEWGSCPGSRDPSKFLGVKC